MDRDEVGQARDRILQPPAVDGSGLEDWIADRSRVPVREHVVVRQDHRPSAATREDAQGPRRNPIVTDTDAALGRPHAMGPPFLHRLRQRHGAEAARLHDVREDAAHLLRHNIAATQLFHRALAFHEDGDAPFPGVLLMDPLGPIATPTTLARANNGPCEATFAAATPSRGIDHPFRSRALISRRPSPSFPPVAVPATRTTRFATNPRKTPMP